MNKESLGENEFVERVESIIKKQLIAELNHFPMFVNIGELRR